MTTKTLNLFKLQYSWYEGDFDSTILATDKNQKEIEKDLKEAVDSIRINEKKTKIVDCLPSAYAIVIEILVKKVTKNVVLYLIQYIL